MIKVIFRMLQDDLPKGDPDIDFAKGGNKYPSNYKEAFNIAKNKLKQAWRRTE